jgi:hypothetical protein
MVMAYDPPNRQGGWQWFVFLSLLGGLGFSHPLYDWPNRKLPEWPAGRCNRLSLGIRLMVHRGGVPDSHHTAGPHG